MQPVNPFYNKSKFKCTLSKHVTASHRIIVRQRHGHCKSGHRQLHKGQCGTRHPRPPSMQHNTSTNTIKSIFPNTDTKIQMWALCKNVLQIWKCGNLAWRRQCRNCLTGGRLVWCAKQKHANRSMVHHICIWAWHKYNSGLSTWTLLVKDWGEGGLE